MIRVNNQIQLNALLPSDEDTCVAYLQERAINEFTLRIPLPYTGKDFRDWLKITEEVQARQGRLLHWAIRRDGCLLGGCGFEEPDPTQAHRAEIGYWLAKPFWNQGIMTAVVQRLCRHGFEELGLEKIVAHVFAGNAASARVLEKCGFLQEGFLRRHFRKQERLIDARVFALLREDSHA